ncbi:MAG: acetyl-CoA carboxylase biotin carboxylase subunit [Phycisphaerales bacterium]|nr:acetyl-CoA carboxylase biotin carboxylase subunit [Phycisphaerales bacterium]
MFKKVLIANRGEVAVRITNTLQQMGIVAVAVHSEPDRWGLHVRRADEAYALEGETAADTYLRINRIIEVAKSCGADAIHPGYGFLSENAAFAQACIDAGIVFIGPTPDVIRKMGDKMIAKTTLADAGVPVVPGYWDNGNADIATLEREAERIGYPVLIKAAAGGGGKGMRVARTPDELRSGVDVARRESVSAFGDDRVFLEKYVTSPRHVEFQIFGDSTGRAVHMFERECSIQRRHQKIIEESPSPALSPELRQEMAAAAVRTAEAIGYTGAGTVEFILDESGSFYFLEVNTRLQVEHPITEMRLQLDLVRLQVEVAAGMPLTFEQNDLKPAGHAIECRIYAEDAARGFLPSVGEIRQFDAPAGANVRLDSGVFAGDHVTVYYDPMLAKLAVWGQTRDEALARMAWALRRFVVTGVTTNIAFLASVIRHPQFQKGEYDTHFLDAFDLEDGEQIPDEVLVAAAMLAGRTKATGHGEKAVTASASPWRNAGRWRGV